MEYEIFKNKKPNRDKVLGYGFKKQSNKFVYVKSILEGEFELKITIDSKNKLKTLLTEKSTNELYTLHLVEGAKGAFIGKIREAYHSTLFDISEKCFDMDVFKYPYSKKIIEYAKQKYGDEVEYLWEKFPENAVCRRKDNKKWYFAILTCKRGKLGKLNPNINPDALIEIIDLRVNYEELPELIEKENIYPAYHMNKKHWASIILDGSMDIKEIYKYIDKSYELAKKK